MMSLYLDPTYFLLPVALVVTVGFLLWKERLHRPMWVVRGAVFALLLATLGTSVPEARLSASCGRS
ncbi:MAG: hypothetical protein JWN15_1061 [Firmicutes bacterium]|nr:hypothetical protein [Bacillota bacterium]